MQIVKKADTRTCIWRLWVIGRRSLEDEEVCCCDSSSLGGGIWLSAIGEAIDSDEGADIFVIVGTLRVKVHGCLTQDIKSLSY